MGILIGTPTRTDNVRRRGEGQIYNIDREVHRVTCANNRPDKQQPTRHEVFVPRQPCGRQDFIKRQNSYAPDADVKRATKTRSINHNQFRKHVFDDGSTTIAPKGYLMSGAECNGARDQGVNRAFIPASEDKENGGFVFT